ncbi:hypothetical protein LCGC14_0652110 [marine sediment metagenome]|uniref:Uncharacterized protein n=1 Tax=marine sediment metagenome TaxID=412755 RepID=A0A0F9U4F2_9ZZZZ
MKTWLKIIMGLAIFGFIKNLNWVTIEQRTALIISAIVLLIIAAIQIKELF